MKKMILLATMIITGMLLFGCVELEPNQAFINDYVKTISRASSFTLRDDTDDIVYKYKNDKIQLSIEGQTVADIDTDTHYYYIDNKWIYDPYQMAHIVNLKELFKDIDVTDQELYLSDYEIYIEAFYAVIKFNHDSEDDSYDFYYQDPFIYGHFKIEDRNKTSLDHVDLSNAITNEITDIEIIIDYNAALSHFYTVNDEIDWDEFTMLVINSDAIGQIMYPIMYYPYTVEYDNKSGLQTVEFNYYDLTASVDFFLYDLEELMAVLLDEDNQIYDAVSINHIDEIQMDINSNYFKFDGWTIYTEDQTVISDIDEISTNVFLEVKQVPKPIGELFNYIFSMEYLYVQSHIDAYYVNGTNIYCFKDSRTFTYTDLTNQKSYEYDQINETWTMIPYASEYENLFISIDLLANKDFNAIAYTNDHITYDLQFMNDLEELYTVYISLNSYFNYIDIEVSTDHFYEWYYINYDREYDRKINDIKELTENDTIIPMSINRISVFGDIYYDDEIIIEAYSKIVLYFGSTSSIRLDADDPSLSYTYDEALNQIIVHYTYDDEIFDGIIDLND